MTNIPIVEGGDITYHFKTLVPAVAAGAIIGKGGETIAAIQKDTGARVKMSKSHDFYPGQYKRHSSWLPYQMAFDSLLSLKPVNRLNCHLIWSWKPSP